VKDDALRAAVLYALQWHLEVDAGRIAVSVGGATVVLAGSVSNAAQKRTAVSVAERIPGVLAVADELAVSAPEPEPAAARDVEVAETVAAELRRNALIPRTVRAEVHRGTVTLRGRVDWPFQRDEAARAIATVLDLQAIVNEIAVRRSSPPDLAEVRRRVVEALAGLAAREAELVSVTASGTTLVLRGRVHSGYSRALAEQVARRASGAADVLNEIVVES
jgi:osmotically-inducible protein OsmY